MAKKFEVGNRVRANGVRGELENQTGVITSITESGTIWVKFDPPVSDSFYFSKETTHRLTLVVTAVDEPTEEEIADLFRIKPPCPTCGCLCAGRP